MAIYGKVTSSDYNAVRTKVDNVLGEGSGTVGYGQTVSSVTRGLGEQVRANEWDRLRNDITSISRHQNASWSGLVNISEGDKVRDDTTAPQTTYDTKINALTSTRFNISPSFSAVTVRKSPSRTGVWNTQTYIIFTCAFPNADYCRWFFNSGAKIRIATSRTGGSSKLLNTKWTNLLNSAGNVDFAAYGSTTGTLKGAYELTNAWQTYYTISDSHVYGTSAYYLQAYCNVANNSGATAKTVYIRVLCNDSNAGETIDGKLQMVLSTIDPAGQPLYGQSPALFTVTPPTVTNGSFSVS